MIIQCESCSKKFQVKDDAIPQEGRMVQCSNCSQKWFQTPIKIQSSIKSDANKNVSKMEFEASDGRVYRFMGSQWAEVLRSGKTGLLAKRTIGAELNRRAGIAKPKKSRKKIKKTTKKPAPPLDRAGRASPRKGCIKRQVPTSQPCGLSDRWPHE